MLSEIEDITIKLGRPRGTTKPLIQTLEVSQSFFVPQTHYYPFVRKSFKAKFPERSFKTKRVVKGGVIGTRIWRTA